MKNKRHISSIIFSILLLAIAAFVYFNKYLCLDFAKSLFYKPTQDVLEIENSLGLTKRARMIFAATNPSLEDSDTFNMHCSSSDINTSVLGCYTNGSIHVYNIDYYELDGILESTTAHELLHAVWERMGESERQNLEKDLLYVYDHNKDIKDEISDSYNEFEKTNELFARAGTEVKELPENLEKVYSRYFEHQDDIVEYYNKYSGTFKKLNRRIEELDAEIKTLGEELDIELDNYEKNIAVLEADINEFNRCAQTLNCFVNMDIFYSRRAELTNRQTETENMYNKVSEDIEKYNLLIEEYNNNVLRGKQLNNIVNSKTPPEL